MAILKEYRDAQIRYARDLAEALVKQHTLEYSEFNPNFSLVAAMLCDELAKGTSDEWICILEIVKNGSEAYWRGEPVAQRFKSTRQFPLRGRLILTVVSPEIFEDALTDKLSMIVDMTEHWEPLFDPTGYLQAHLGNQGSNHAGNS